VAAIALAGCMGGSRGREPKKDAPRVVQMVGDRLPAATAPQVCLALREAGCIVAADAANCPSIIDRLDVHRGPGVPSIYTSILSKPAVKVTDHELVIVLEDGTVVCRGRGH
jgi:hypothetical protein